MHIPPDVRNNLSVEFSFAAKQMADTEDMQAILFFFSAFYGAVHRALNLAWSDELALMHSVLQSTHQQINGLILAAASGQRPIGLAEEFPGALKQACNDLASLFENEDIEIAALHALLTRFAVISYASTGNGRYLSRKGQIKL
jgi:hypothetical protein